MRKTIQTVLLVFSSVLVIHAQTIIPKAGLSLSTNTASEAEDGIENTVSAKPGFTVGIGYNLPVGTVGKGVFSIQPELTFVQKGFKVKSSGEFYDGEAIYDVNAEQKYTVNYLELPVLAKLEFGTGNARFFTYAGPSLGFGFGGKIKGDITFDDGFQSITEKIDGDIKFGDAPQDSGEENDDVYLDNRLDVGVQLGAGVTLFNKVVIDVRYGLGLTDLADSGDSANRVLQFTVGIPIALK